MEKGPGQRPGLRGSMSVILYGECIGARGSAPVRILELADGGCDLEATTPATTLEGEDFALWIGAVGPFHARAERKAERKGPKQFSARFHEPLDRRILEHFRA